MLKMRLKLYDPGVAPRFEVFVERLRDLRPFYKNWFIPRYLKDVQTNFNTEGGMVGGWDPLSPEYAEWKENNYPGKKINYLKGRLQRSFGIKGRSKFLKIEFNPKTAVVTNTLPHAPFVQRRRPVMIPPSMLDSRVYNKLFNDYIQLQAKKAGFTPDETGEHKSKSAFGPSWFDNPLTWSEAMRKKFKAEERSYNRTGSTRAEAEDDFDDDEEF